MNRLYAPVLFCLALILVACPGDTVRTIERETLFSLDIGKNWDEIDLFIGDSGVRYKNRVFSRDGRVFISNGNANKFMEFTGAGDLLLLLYDPELNPEPLLPERGAGNGATRRSERFSFSAIGEVAIGGDRMLLVEDQDGESGPWDEELGVRLRSRILRFVDGQYVDFLGQEGVGGTRFPHIERLDVTRYNDIVVTTRVNDGRRVFWYDSNGVLVYEVPISHDQLPMPETADTIPSLESVFPDPERDFIYLKIDYYERADAGVGQADISDVYSKIYYLDLQNGVYRGPIDIPRNTSVVRSFPDFEEHQVDHLYRAIGAGPNGHIFLHARDDAGENQLLIMNRSSEVVARRIVQLEDEPLVDVHLSVSPEGILVVLLGRRDRADVVWWRTDRLLGR